ncbi:MAG TPA: gluconokinase [Nitrococcus sp.]|nr:gluconokinase [Nitrococcus sp.]
MSDSNSGIVVQVIKAKAQIRSPTIVLVMGVSGSGKTTVAAMLAGRLHWPFADGDDFHSPENIAKMHSGIPLDDDDRLPWLQAIAAQIDRWRAEHSNGVVVCSALKRRYRDLIIGARPGVRLVYLQGDRALIARRLAARHGHFMPGSLLQSQFDALEEPAPEEQAISIWIGKPPVALVDEIIAALAVTPLKLPHDTAGSI